MVTHAVQSPHIQQNKPTFPIRTRLLGCAKPSVVQNVLSAASTCRAARSAVSAAPCIRRVSPPLSGGAAVRPLCRRGGLLLLGPPVEAPALVEAMAHCPGTAPT